MAQYRLVYIDTVSIQEYIFGSNDLKQNIGASELVAQATRDWVFDVLDEMKKGGGNEKKRVKYHGT